MSAPSGGGTVRCYYDVVSTEAATAILRNTYSFSEMKIDGITMPVSTSYLFSSIGEHLVEFTLVNKEVIGVHSEDHPFRQLTQLRRVVIPNTVTTLGRSIFYENRSVQHIELPHSIVSIGNECFNGCSAWVDEVSLPNLETLGSSAFQGCGISKILDLGKITTLLNSTIRNTGTLTDLVLPATITSLADASVYNVYALKRLTCYAETPPSASNNVFYKATLEYIRVPAGSVDSYKASSFWSNYSSVIEAIPNN